MNKSLLLFVFFLCWVSQLKGQNLEGKVSDQNDDPIGYANIGVIGKNRGTVSRPDGTFQLSLENLKENDVIRFSMVGFKHQDIMVRDAKLFLEISLEEYVTQLEDVIVNAKRKKNKTTVLGIKKKWCFPIPFNTKVSSNIRGFSQYPGEEIGSYYPLENKVYALDSVRLNFYSAESDTTKFRLNIYDSEGKNILTEPIYVFLSREEAASYPTINLVQHNIKVNSDFIVAIENIEGVGGLTILSTFKKKAKIYRAVRRKNNQSDWEYITSQGLGTGNTGISFVAFLDQLQ